MLPYNRRLQKEVTLQYTVKGVIKQATFKLKYERVPHFCFHCGFMGHDKDVCEKKLRGLASKGYDSMLRCSPFKKFEFRAAYTPSPGQPRARRDLNFNLGSTGAAVHGARSASSRASSYNNPVQQQDMIPSRVDAKDGFDDEEREAAPEEDSALAAEIESLQMKMAGEKPESSKAKEMTNKFEAKAAEKGKCPTPKQMRKKGAAPGKKPASKKAGALVIRDNTPGQEDMIPALRDLNASGGSLSSVLDSMDFNDSVLGKRQGELVYQQAKVVNGEKALVPFVEMPSGGIQKKGRLGAVPHDKQEDHIEEEDIYSREENQIKEATGHGAAGKLTGPSVVPRQEQ